MEGELDWSREHHPDHRFPDIRVMTEATLMSMFEDS
jgi:hypothetical protein